MKKFKYVNPFYGRNYFSENLLPSEVFAGHRTVRQSIPFTQHDDLELLLIRKGEGILTVNAAEYPLSRGMLFCFSPHHFHKLTLPRGHTLEVSECHVNSGVYFYITACPYFIADERTVPYPPLLARLDETHVSMAEALMDQITGESTKKTVKIAENQNCFFLMMKLFGLLEKFSVPDA